MDGEVINTGDILHGDANGIVVVPPSVIDGLPAAVEKVREHERKIMEFYRSDRFTIADAKAGRGY